MRDLPQLKQYGHFVSKNTKVAIKLQSCNVGESFEHKQLDYIKRMRTHRIVLENRADFQNQKIEIAGDSLLYQYRDIHDFLSALQKNQGEMYAIERRIVDLKQSNEELKKLKDTSTRRSQNTRTINALQREYRILAQQQEDLKNITIYIRKQGEMRYSLIVDPIQTKIKSQNLFDGKTIIIDGGPGTGKTTTMIHRLSYLTDTTAIDEDETDGILAFKLNSRQRQQLRDSIMAQRDWVFFSPSQLLKEYLSDAMKKEGLTNTSQKVWNWKDYCRLVLQENYHLLESSTAGSFKVCHLSETLFYQNSRIIDEFTGFYLQQFRQINNLLPKLDSGGVTYEWTAIANSINLRFAESQNYDIAHFVSLFNSLESVYGEDCRRLLQGNNSAIKAFADELCILLDKNTKAKSELIDLLDLVPDETDNDEDESSDVEPEDKLYGEVRKWLRAYSYSMVDDSYSVSGKQQMMNDIILPVLGQDYDNRIRKIGELIVFEQFAKYTRGIGANMLRGLPERYRKFRTHLIKTQFEGCNLKLLREIMQRKQGRELHFQEQSLLLGFINNLVKTIKSTTSASIRHDFIEAYEEVSRPIIGIDEATDFCACDIYAMQSLLTREFNSLTLCGDMMQRLTDYGIKSWSELDGIIPDYKVVNMETSYRQSKKLIDVAKQLYFDTQRSFPVYKAFMKSDKVPYPLYYVDENETSKIHWESKRIEEVYKAYGEQLPSIAIFVNYKGYIPKFIASLQATPFFAENGVRVIDGTEERHTSKDSHISVYPIDVVKGMEFDVVFFHNIDNSSVDTERLRRYIYVGVSRAAFFLAVTLSEPNEALCKYFVKDKDWFKI